MEHRLLLFVGCLNREAPYFEGARGKGIAVFAFDPRTLTTECLCETADIDNPTFLTPDPRRGTLYASSEIFGRPEGTVASYRVDFETGALRYLNMQPSLGSICAYTALSADGRFLLLANYGMGSRGPDRSLAVFPIGEDGSLSPAASSAGHEGRGPNAERQERAHAHCIRPLGPDGALLCADLGLDQLVHYRLAPDGALTRTAETPLASGAGPRHLAISADALQVFVVNELGSTVQSFRKAADGTLRLASSVPAVPTEAGENHSADLHLSPDGRHLYASNRGHDSIAIFAVDPATAELSPRGHQPSLGRTPRSFAITPDGGHLLVANQNSDEIAVFRRSSEDGRLDDTGARIAIGTPMCVRVVARAGTHAG